MFAVEFYEDKRGKQPVKEALLELRDIMASNTFSEFYNDDANVSPVERARIEFEVELIGKLIAVREAKGLTQKQLAESVGIKQSVVARMETLKAIPQINTLFKVLTPMGFKLSIVPMEERV